MKCRYEKRLQLNAGAILRTEVRWGYIKHIILEGKLDFHVGIEPNSEEAFLC